MTNRASWSRWEVGDPFLQQVPGKPDGVTEARCMVTCPHCKESINVAAANARKNLSLTARQHQKKCECLSTVRQEALPASKRPRTEAAGDHPSAMNALQRELAEKDRRLRMYAEGRRGSSRATTPSPRRCTYWRSRCRVRPRRSISCSSR